MVSLGEGEALQGEDWGEEKQENRRRLDTRWGEYKKVHNVHKMTITKHSAMTVKRNWHFPHPNHDYLMIMIYC